MSSWRSSRWKPRRPAVVNKLPEPETGDATQERDVVSLMAWDTPPWKQPRSNRDRWLKKDDESHRRREREHRPRRSRAPERAKDKKDVKGSGKCKYAQSSILCEGV